MRKGENVIFKTYTMEQPSLLPTDLAEKIPEQHLVREVDATELEPLLAKYQCGGTSSCHPRMMLNVLVNAYSEKVFTSRRIEKELRENVNFIWLAGGSRPDFWTINRLVMKGEVREVFTIVFELLRSGFRVDLEFGYH